MRDGDARDGRRIVGRYMTFDGSETDESVCTTSEERFLGFNRKDRSKRCVCQRVCKNMRQLNTRPSCIEERRLYALYICGGWRCVIGLTLLSADFSAARRRLMTYVATQLTWYRMRSTSSRSNLRPAPRSQGQNLASPTEPRPEPRQPTEWTICVYGVCF